MHPIRLVNDVHWIGSLDPDRSVFDVIMPLTHGTSYNAYVVRGAGKTAVIETTKNTPAMQEQFFSRLRGVADHQTIDYVVLNHLEPDHSGALASLLQIAPQTRVVVSRSGEHFVRNLLNQDVKPLTVTDGDTLDLGGRTLRFFATPFLHWPDTMVTYVPEDGILFSSDFLGSHYCDERLFNDRTGEFTQDFAYYYDTLMRPFKDYVLRALDKIRPLPVTMICPSHGPVLRSNIQYYTDKYEEWSRTPVKAGRKRAVVAYVSAYGNTARMARAVTEGLEAAAVDVDEYDVAEGLPDGFVSAVEAADALVVGSPTFVGDALKPVWTMLASFANIKVKGKSAAAFGSFGWSGEAVGLMEERLSGLKMKVVGPGVRATLAPTDEDLEKCRELGRKVADALA